MRLIPPTAQLRTTLRFTARLAALAACALGPVSGCAPAGEDWAPRLIHPEQPPPAPIAPRPDPTPTPPPPEWVPPGGEARPPRQRSPFDEPVPGGPRLDSAPLPAPWPVELPPTVAPSLARRVLVTERVVGLAAYADGGFWAVGAEGGQFEARAHGRLVALRTALEPGVLRAESAGRLRVVCRADGARWSVGGGPFEVAPFACDAAGRRSVALDNGGLWVLSGGRVHRGEGRADDPRPTRFDPREVPVAGPTVVAAVDDAVVVFGVDGAAWSVDGGRSFRPSAWPAGAPAVRDAAFVGKAILYAVGASAGAAGPPEVEVGAMLRSLDGGRSFEVVPDLPRRFEDLHAVAVDALGGVVAVTELPGGGALASDPDGRFVPIDAGGPVGGAVVAHARRGVVVGSARGVARTLGPAPRGPLGLDGPLWRAVFTHPRVGVAAGLHGGLYRTEDGGRTWAPVPGSAGLTFTALARDGGHGLWAAGPALLWRGEAGGRRFSARSPASRCGAPELSFAPGGGRGLLTCAEGTSQRTEDGGQTWVPGPTLPEALTQPRFLDAVTVVARSPEPTPKLWWSHDGGASWGQEAAPEKVSDLDVLPGSNWTVSLLGADGSRWQRAAHADWVQVGAPGRLAGAVRHRLGAEGRVVHTDGASIFVEGLRVAPAAEAFDLQPTGDGSLLVFESGSATLLEPR